MAKVWKKLQRADGDFTGTLNGTNASTVVTNASDGASRPKTFKQNDPPTSINIGDIWYDTNDNNIMYFAESVGADQIASGEWVQVKQGKGANTYDKNDVGLGNVTNHEQIKSDGTNAPDSLKNDQITLTASGGTVTLNNAGSGSIDKGDIGLGSVDDKSMSEILAGEVTGTIATSVTVGGTSMNTIKTEANTGAAKPTTFRQDGIPTALNAGDIWIDTNDDNKQYRATATGDDAITSGEWEPITPAKGAVGLGNVVNESPSDLKATMSLDNVDNNSTATILGGTLTGTVSSSANIGSTAASTVVSGASDGATAKGITDDAFTDDGGTPKLNVANANNSLRNDQISLSASEGTVTLSGASSSNNTFTKSSIGLSSVENKSQADILAGDLTGKVGSTSVSDIETGASNGTAAKTITDDTFEVVSGVNTLKEAKAPSTLKNSSISISSSSGTVTVTGIGGGSNNTFGKSDVGLSSVVNQAITMDNGKLKFDNVAQTIDADKVGGSTKSEVESSAASTAETNILDGAPEGLQTLNELAEALNDDASFHTTTTNALATKGPAPLTLAAEDVDGDSDYSSSANNPANLTEGQVGIYNGEQYVVINT